MGRIKQKGKAGAAKAYVTRTAAIKKLQCTLADFRRLCILKGIFPREPRNKKKANKGSSAPTSFYYAKDIAYIAHEPVLKKLREHKAFAKKLARALGRGEWSSAKSLEENKPVYRLDHIIKERYPTFIDAIRDIDDALCMVFLFSSLPSHHRISPALIENCARLAAEWQLFVMHTRSLRKVFLSIKGVYYQAEIMDQTVTWLVPYQFTQKIPQDVDARVMLTFLELYQTLLGFVFFKLYTDTGLVYPPPLDAKKEEGAAGVNAFNLQELSHTIPQSTTSVKVVEVDGKKVSSKDVNRAIKIIAADFTGQADEIMEAVASEAEPPHTEEEFVPQPSTSDPQAATILPTLQFLSALPPTVSTDLFSQCTFFISRETSRPIFEFIIRSFGGRIGWPLSSGIGSPFDETHDSITHVIIDRPVVQKPNEPPEERERRLRRKYIQPQWVVDCINAGKILLEEPYLQGKTLPPHLSPFGEYEGAYNPSGALNALDVDMSQAEADEDSEEEEDVEEEGEGEEDGDRDGEKMHAITEERRPTKIALKALAATGSEDLADLRTVELAAEAAGVDYGTFEKEISKARKKAKKDTAEVRVDHEQDMNKMMMSNKQKKLYERMRYGEKKRAAERAKLEQKRRDIDREMRRQVKGLKKS